MKEIISYLYTYVRHFYLSFEREGLRVDLTGENAEDGDCVLVI